MSTTAVIGQYAPPPPRPALNPGWDRMRLYWQGWNGSEWPLTSPVTGVFLIRGGVRGFGMPKIEHYRDRSPALHGAFHRGTTYAPREMFWPVHLFHDGSSREWVERDSAWWRSLHPEHEGTLVVEIPGVSTRRIRLRLESDEDWAPEVDPTFFGWATYGIRLQADQPLWEGETVTRDWTPDDIAAFHGGLDDGAPIINIGGNRSMATATLPNPGDVEQWATWTIHGDTGFVGASITVNGQTIAGEFDLDVGERVVIDTRPDVQTALKTDANGVVTDVFDQLSDIDFAPIAAGTAADLILTTGGTGSISASLVPLHLRAWG